MEDIESTIRRFIVREILFEEDESILELDDPLLEREIIDSPSLVHLVLFLDKEFNISIPQDDVVPENFETIQTLCAYLRSNGLAR